MTTLDLTMKALRRTQEALLTRMIVSCIARDTGINQLLQPLSKLAVYPFEPPRSQKLPTPGLYVWFSRADPELYAQNSQNWDTLYGTVKFVLKNNISAKPLLLASNGKFDSKQRFMTQQLPLFEMYYLKQRMKYIFEVDGYDNNWYYVFVNNGIQGKKNESRYDIVSFGGGDTNQELTHHLTCSFRVYTWSESSVIIPNGDITFTVDGPLGAVASATVYIEDAKGNRIEDENGVHEWITNGSGQVTVSGLVSQKTVTCYASTSTLSGSSTRDISQATDQTQLIIIS